MEVVDNAVMLLGAGRHGGGPDERAVLGRAGGRLAVAFVVTVPVNRWLIGRGRGHAVVHAHH